MKNLENNVRGTSVEIWKGPWGRSNGLWSQDSRTNMVALYVSPANRIGDLYPPFHNPWPHNRKWPRGVPSFCGSKENPSSVVRGAQHHRQWGHSGTLLALSGQGQCSTRSTAWVGRREPTTISSPAWEASCPHRPEAPICCLEIPGLWHQ